MNSLKEIAEQTAELDAQSLFSPDFITYAETELVPPPASASSEECYWETGSHEASEGINLSGAQKRILPSYMLILRMLKNSLVEYVEDPSCREDEIAFWRGRYFTYYGTLLCEMDNALFNRTVTLADLRRGAEHRLGLPAGHLSMNEVLSEDQVDELNAQTGLAFRFIKQSVGHVEDPEVESLFTPSKKKRKSRKKATVAPAPITQPLTPLQPARPGTLRVVDLAVQQTARQTQEQYELALAQG